MIYKSDDQCWSDGWPYSCHWKEFIKSGLNSFLSNFMSSSNFNRRYRSHHWKGDI